MTIHSLKTHPRSFSLILSGQKPWEYRKNDRSFENGDVLKLEEWADNDYTGRVFLARVSCIFRGPEFGIPEGCCIMGITKKGDGGSHKWCDQCGTTDNFWEGIRCQCGALQANGEKLAVKSATRFLVIEAGEQTDRLWSGLRYFQDQAEDFKRQPIVTLTWPDGCMGAYKVEINSSLHGAEHLFRTLVRASGAIVIPLKALCTD